MRSQRSSNGPGSRHVEQRAAIPAGEGGTVRLAVIADTHSCPHPNTAKLVAATQPDAVLHAGDIGELSVLAPFREIAPLFVVRGNIDVRAADLPDVLDLEVTSPGSSEHPGETVLRLLLLHIGVNGPRVRADAARLARKNAADVVVCGHSHVPFIGRDRGLTVFNPGSAGPRRFALPIVFGVLELAAGKLRAWHVDCETGARWEPP